MRPFLLATLCLACLHATAQNTDSLLKKYKYRTPHFRALVFDFNLNGNLSHAEGDLIVERTVNSFSLYPTFLQYYTYSSTDNHTRSNYINAGPSFSSVKDVTTAVKRKNSLLNLAAGWAINNRQYRNKNFFVETGNTLNVSGIRYKNSENDLSQKTTGQQVQDDVTLGIGKGRIEQVQDMQMALFILNDLQRQGLLEMAATPENTNEFARLITSINNRRVFDSRRRRIYELTQIDSFLRSRHLVNEPDIRSFTTINDNWALAFNPFRQSGTAWFFRLQPGVRLSHTKLSAHSPADMTTRIETSRYSLRPSVGFEKFVPVNLKWQHNMGTEIFARYSTENRNSHYTTNGGQPTNTKDELQETAVGVSAYYSLGYYPNNRTFLNAGASIEATHSQFKRSTLQQRNHLAPSVFIDMNYFIGYRTTLKGSFSLQHQQENNKATSGLIKLQQTAGYYYLTFSHILF